MGHAGYGTIQPTVSVRREGHRLFKALPRVVSGEAEGDTR